MVHAADLDAARISAFFEFSTESRLGCLNPEHTRRDLPHAKDSEWIGPTGKLAMDALGYVIEDLGPERLNQQLWWAVGTLAAVHMMP